MACAEEDGRNYKISHAPRHWRGSWNGMRHIDNKKTPVDCEQAHINWHFFIICIAYFIIPIDIVGYKRYNPIMFVGIIGFNAWLSVKMGFDA